MRCSPVVVNSRSQTVMTGSNVTRSVPARGVSVRGTAWARAAAGASSSTLTVR